MAEQRMKIEARRNEILSQLRRDGTVKISRLCQLLDATPVTVRHDLDALAKEGRLVRVPGGAVPKAQPVPEYGSRDILHLPEKQAVAAAVAGLIQDGDTLFLNSGSTTECVASALGGRRNLSIVTNSLGAALTLRRNPTFRVIQLGGEINLPHAFTYGCDALEQLERYQADWAILSVDGISPHGGITSCHTEETIMNRLMMERSGSTVVAADYSKIGCDGFYRVSEIHTGIRLVTDGKADGAALSALRELGMDILLAGGAL